MHFPVPGVLLFDFLLSLSFSLHLCYLVCGTIKNLNLNILYRPHITHMSIISSGELGALLSDHAESGQGRQAAAWPSLWCEGTVVKTTSLHRRCAHSSLER